MKIIKIAYTPDQNRKKIDNQERDIKGIRSDIRDIKRDLKNAIKNIDSLNIGNRRFWQANTIFNSLQRKIERFEKLEREWNKYKEDMDGKVKMLVEKKVRAEIK